MGLAHLPWLVICRIFLWSCCLSAPFYFLLHLHTAVRSMFSTPCHWGSLCDLGLTCKLRLHEVCKAGVRRRGPGRQIPTDDGVRTRLDSRLQHLVIFLGARGGWLGAAEWCDQPNRPSCTQLWWVDLKTKSLDAPS